MKPFYRIQKIPKKIITRKLPTKGKLFVETGEIVTPADILGEYRQAAGFHIVNTGLQLGVNPSKAAHYITRRVGEKVFKGEILAEKKQLFKKESDRVYASIDGTIDNINTKNGQIMLRITKKSESIPAGVWGKVINTVDSTSVDIETQVIQFQGKLGRGFNREGSIKVIASKHEVIKEHMIKEEHADKILFGGSMLPKSALSKAINIGVMGFITGGIEYQDLIAIGAESDIGITIVAMEGFGTIPINDELYSEFIRYENYYCFISGQDNTIIIPLDKMDQKENKQEQEKNLEINAKVRIVFDQNIGEIGIVKELIAEHTFRSGIKSPAAKITFKNNEYIIPQNNIEILD
ncbi:MAG: hypothetical protein M3Q44_06945 [bacterium]|nr:hypothetical protein [bacterium]